MTILTLQPDTGGFDTQLYGRSSQNTYDWGALANIWCGAPVSTNELYRGLLRFDYSLPGGVIVSSAVLTLAVNDGSDATNRQISVHRCLVQWYEGPGTGGGAPAAGVDASVWAYRNYNGLVAWGAAGGLAGTDYVAAATATATVSNTEASAATWDVTADVAAWAGGATNWGWFIISNAEATTGAYKVFYSSDYQVNALLRPKLVITYAPGGGAGAGGIGGSFAGRGWRP